MSDDVIADLAEASALLGGLVDFGHEALDPADVATLQLSRNLIDATLVKIGRRFDVDVVV